MHPVHFASRKMNSAERNYFTREREALELAVMSVRKEFRVYFLLFQPFELIINHQELQYTFKKKDIYGRLARLSSNSYRNTNLGLPTNQINQTKSLIFFRHGKGESALCQKQDERDRVMVVGSGRGQLELFLENI